MSGEELPDGAGIVRLPKRSPLPSGAVERFIADVRTAYGQGYVASWLTSRTCLFEEAVIWTFDLGHDTLTRQCERLLAKHGVTVKVDDQSRAHFKRSTEDVLLKG